MPQQPGSRLLQKLVGFDRISDLKPGASSQLAFTLDAETLALADLNTGDLVQTPGNFDLSFADGSGNEVVVPLEIVGDQYVVEEFPRVQ